MQSIHKNLTKKTSNFESEIKKREMWRQRKWTIPSASVERERLACLMRAQRKQKDVEAATRYYESGAGRGN